MKYGVISAIVALAILGGCNSRSSAPASTPTPTPTPAPIESPLNQKPAVEKKKGTPRLDALEKRVNAIEAKIKKYEQKYGGQ